MTTSYDKGRVASMLRLRCWSWTYDGNLSQRTTAMMQRCTIANPDGSQVMFTRDEGHHFSGWFKNPDYERCFHLSISYWDPVTMEPRDHDDSQSRQWCRVFFRDDVNKVWAEGAAYEVGKSVGVRHFRIFTDKNWVPIIPRKEVYSKDFTPLGWKSWSEIQNGFTQVVELGS